ncbi:MAG: hypothetical protein NZ921_01990 [Candidatus Caldarchaeum sp.]|nr:hypothetical protein [Candidatus Caldarchaeum sp.]
MKTAKAFGYFLMAFAVFAAVFYVLWWAGAIPFLHRDDAVRLTALVVTIAILLAVGFIGYVTVTTKPPKPITPRQPTPNPATISTTEHIEQHRFQPQIHPHNPK